MEIKSPFDFFDAIYCINLDLRKDRWNNMNSVFEELEIQKKIIRFSAFYYPENGNTGVAISVRKIIEIAVEKKYKNILILEDDLEIIDYSKTQFMNSIEQLKRMEKWDLFYLGGTCTKYESPYFLKQNTLFKVAGIGCGTAIAYNNSIYGDILNILPPEIKKMEEFILKYGSFDHYFVRKLQAKKYTFMPEILIFTQRATFSDIVKSFSNVAKEKKITINILKRSPMKQLTSLYMHHVLMFFWKIKFEIHFLKKKILRKIKKLLLIK